MSTRLKIRVDSNIMREPQRLEDMGNMAAGFARDLMLFAAHNNSLITVVHLPEFCAMFRYSRQNLLRPLDDAKATKMKKIVRQEHFDNLNCSLGWTILSMAKWNLVFYSNDPKRVPQTLSKKTLECRYSSLQILTDFSPESCLNKHKTGTMATLYFSERFIYNCREFYQELDVEDYLSLANANGKPDDRARRLYMHMTWRRQLWDGVVVPNKNFDPAKPEYDELLSVAGLKFADKKRNATELRALLKKVCRLPTVNCEYEVRNIAPKDTYEVQLKKLGGRIRPKRAKRPKQQKLAL